MNFYVHFLQIYEKEQKRGLKFRVKVAKRQWDFFGLDHLENVSYSMKIVIFLDLFLPQEFFLNEEL